MNLSSFKRRQFIGLIVAVALLSVIFIPFQKANAFTATTTLPGSSGNTLIQTAAGNDVRVTISVAAGEFVSLSQVEWILDNGQVQSNGLPAVKRTVFDSSGARISGDRTLITGNTITITPSSTTGYAYGYGYGYVSTGTTVSAPYSYAFTAGNALLSGNIGGYTYAMPNANARPGYIGPVDLIISGKLNTPLMSVGTHTLDVLIHTASGGNGVDKIVSPRITFTVNQNAAIVQTSVSSGTNVAVPPVTVAGVGTVSITISNVQAAGTVVVEPKSVSSLTSQFSGIFTSTSNASPQFTVGTSTFNAIGQILDIDLSSVSLGSGATITITLPYDPASLPGGISPSDLKILHFNTSTNTWEQASNISVNTTARTITGTLTSLSPVTIGFQSSTTTTSTTSGTTVGGGGGGGIGAVDLTGTYPDSFFVSNPLAKIQVSKLAVVNAQGNQVFHATSGQQVSITSSFKNYQQGSQTYAFIVQVIDKDGSTTDLSWQTGKLEGGQTATLSRSWTVGDAGVYQIKVFIWNSVTQAPVPLSQGSSATFSVT